MCVVSQIRKAGKKFLGPRATSYVQDFTGTSGARLYRSALRERHGLEIGGPSGIFGDGGPFPVYQALGGLDNCLYSAQTIWTGDVPQGRSFHYHPLKRPGNQIIGEAAELQTIKDSAYECVLASHCLEHVANPLRALGAWKRVLRRDGLLLLVLPHKAGTFDWRRPTTSLAHMIEDYRDGIKEDDLTPFLRSSRYMTLRKTRRRAPKTALSAGVCRITSIGQFTTMSSTPPPLLRWWTTRPSRSCGLTLRTHATS